jgi:hypothetical protein
VSAACTWEAVPQLERQQRRDAGAKAVATHHQLPPLPLDPPLHNGRRVLASLVALQIAIAVTRINRYCSDDCQLPLAQYDPTGAFSMEIPRSAAAQTVATSGMQ